MPVEGQRPIAEQASPHDRGHPLGDVSDLANRATPCRATGDIDEVSISSLKDVCTPLTITATTEGQGTHPPIATFRGISAKS